MPRKRKENFENDKIQNNEINEINARKKKIDGILSITAVFFVLLILILYILYFRRLEIFQDSFLTLIVSHIKNKIAAFNLLGSFYVSLFGGLFFIFVPMEAYFINALRYNPALIITLVFICGIIISYTADYLIGMKMSRLSRKLISPKKFYKIKSFLNRFGKPAIFAVHAIPFLPSQQVTFVLGVFRYNPARLFILGFLGQALKYAALAFLYTAIV